MPDTLQEIDPVWREGVDQPAGFKRLYPVNQTRRDDEAATGFELFRLSVDGDLELAFGNVARLHMRVRMQGADAALFEGELDHHQFVGMKNDAAAVAVGRRRLRATPSIR